MNICHLTDCMEFMKALPDNAFDLAIVDPPYGIGAEQGTNRANRRQFADKVYGWDSSAPNAAYFQELKRISVNRIIWGANHFIENIPDSNSKHWIIWDKKNPDRCFADCEMALGSNMDTARIMDLSRVQELNRADGGKIHPTQKPVALYKWLLKNYAKPGQTIFDSHVGSGSIRIACHDLGYDFTGCEIDADYYAAQEKRFQTHISQAQLFEPAELTAQYHQEEL